MALDALGRLQHSPARRCRRRVRSIMGAVSARYEADADLDAARHGDGEAFDRLISKHRRALHAHCYRMVGSVHDADDALQETLLAAWRGLAGFQGRAPLHHWLHRIATNTCIRLAARRPQRLLADAYGPPRGVDDGLGEPVVESVWIEPYPDAGVSEGPASPEARYEQRESIELAFVAALQHLPATQRAVLLLRDVVGFPAADVAALVGTTVASVNSALQRARATLEHRLDPVSQQQALVALGEPAKRALVDGFVDAWEKADIDRLVALLTEDVRFTMPPLPAWFDGLAQVRRFFVERIFETPWRLVPITANGQLGFVCHQSLDSGSTFVVGAVNVLTLRDGRIAAINGFVDPAVRDASPRFLAGDR
jgi:RNA polymerase sigma-70 factor (TIGR02960 family)